MLHHNGRKVKIIQLESEGVSCFGNETWASMNHSLLACTLRAEGPQSELRTTKAGLSASARTQYPVELIMVCNSCAKQFSAEVFCAEIKYSWKLGWIYRSAYQWPKQALSKPMGGIDFTKTEFRSLLNT